MAQPDESCEQCQHPRDPHALLGTGASPLDGGIMLCPVEGCRCYSIWSTVGRSRESVTVPPEATIEEWRSALQEGAL